MFGTANFMAQTRVGDFIRPKVIASITPNDNIQTILQILNSNKILSAPVCDLLSNSLVGIVSMADIAIALLSFIGTQEMDRNALNSLEKNGEEFMQFTAAKVLGISQVMGKYNEINFPIKIGSPLLQVVELFSKNVHRAPVLTEDNTLMNYLTQTEVIHFMAQNLFLLGDTAGMTLDALGICNYEKIISVTENIMVMDVIKILAAHNISAVPVLDSDGRLLANFSLSNLKGLRRESFSELFLTVMDYLQLQRIKESENFISINNTRALRPQCCRATDTFENTIYKLVATKVHRLWVVDSQFRVVGVISIGDLFKPFLEPPPAQMPIT